MADRRQTLPGRNFSVALDIGWLETPPQQVFSKRPHLFKPSAAPGVIVLRRCAEAT